MSEQWPDRDDMLSGSEFSDADDVKNFVVNTPIWWDRVAGRLTTNDFAALTTVARQIGLNLGELLIDLRDIPPNQQRAIKFKSLGDALTYLTDAGLLAFSKVSVDKRGRFVVAVGDTNPEVRAALEQGIDDNDYTGDGDPENIEF